MTLSNRRTPNQDIAFSINQIVEVAVRALSPGINDPQTAISCIHWLGAALVIISKKHFPNIYVRDKDDVVRIIKKDFTYTSIVGTCFDQLRLYAQTNILVTVEMLQIIKVVLLQSKKTQLNEALVKKAATIYELVDKETLSQEDRLNLLQTYEGVKKGSRMV